MDRADAEATALGLTNQATKKFMLTYIESHKK
jgi:hypothetical protein